MNPDNWETGPVISAGNYSVGVPARPAKHPNGWIINIPLDGGRLNYMTMDYGSLTGKTRITMRYRIEAEPGTEILPASDRRLPSIITLYFQRAGDNWTADSRTEMYRWWATFASQMPIKVGGEYEISAPLNGNWTAVLTSSAITKPAEFKAAIDNADRVGFTLGGGTGYGHGVFATAPANLIVTAFRVE